MTQCCYLSRLSINLPSPVQATLKLVEGGIVQDQNSILFIQTEVASI